MQNQTPGRSRTTSIGSLSGNSVHDFPTSANSAQNLLTSLPPPNIRQDPNQHNMPPQFNVPPPNMSMLKPPPPPPKSLPASQIRYPKEAINRSQNSWSKNLSENSFEFGRQVGKQVCLDNILTRGYKMISKLYEIFNCNHFDESNIISIFEINKSSRNSNIVFKSLIKSILTTSSFNCRRNVVI